MYEQGIARTDDPEATRAKMTSLRPLGRLGAAEEEGRVPLFLACDASSYMTSATLPVDGSVTSQFAGQVRSGAQGAFVISRAPCQGNRAIFRITVANEASARRRMLERV